MTRALIFDTELTGRDGEIIEAAWIEIASSQSDLFGARDGISQPLQVASQFSQRYKPSIPLTFGAMAVHHILPGDLDICPQEDFRLPADTDYIIGHSIDNDWAAAGRPEAVKRIDTHAIAQWLWPDASGYSQVALIYMLLGPTIETRDYVLDKAHHAWGDARLCKDLLEHILLRKPEIQTWTQLWEYSEECRIPRTCPLKRWQGVPLEDMTYDAIDWCLRQYWIDPYFRKGLNRVRSERRGSDARFEDEGFDTAGGWE